VLAAICSRRPRKDVPLDRLRGRVLFETAYACGTRAAEACGLYVEDLDLRTDDQHVRIHGKGGTVRTVLLDDRGYVALLRLYLARAGYTAGPLFRASINGSGGPLSYDAALLSDPAARYTDLGYGYYQARTDKDRKIRNHIRQIEALGFTVALTKAT